MKMRSFVVVGLFSVCGVVYGCSVGGEDGDDDGENGSNNTNAGGAGGGVSLGGNGVGGGLDPVGSGGGESCAETAAEATTGLAPADIIVAVDTSGSMSAEAQWTQDNMNVMVNAIVGSGVDAHLVMISDSDICVPGPLGSGSCPADESLPAYRHVPVGVGSTNALQIILDTYDQWKDSLRPSASKTIVVVSDDDSNLGASSFTSQLIALDATFQGYKFDAIVSSAPPFLPGPCFVLSADTGQVYIDLVNQTQGVFGDLCSQNFAPVFQDMATAVVNSSQIPCIYDIPDSGSEIDFGKVNVEYTADANGMPEGIFNVPGAADCDASGGWYYDAPANPTQILLCPTTCTAVQSSSDGSVSVKFGCATKIN
jgi:hypothetical protein